MKIKRWLLFGVLSLAANEVFVHHEVKERWDATVQWYEHWQEERRLNYQKRKEQKVVEKAPEEVQDAVTADIKEVQEINRDRLKRIAERAQMATQFKEYILENPDELDYGDVFFPIEYFSQGIEDWKMDVSHEVFRLRNDDLDRAMAKTSSLYHELLAMSRIFMPPGSHHRLRSSAVHSLATNLGPKSQSCYARLKLMIMSAAQKYPQFRDGFYIQYFGDHGRSLLEADGERFILEGDISAFPDLLTEEKRSEVFPLSVWLQIYAGRDRALFEDQIEYYGPPARTPEQKEEDGDSNYPRITDDLINFPISPDLDNVGDVNSWYSESDGVPSVGGGWGQPRKASRGKGGFLEPASSLQSLVPPKSEVVHRSLRLTHSVLTPEDFPSVLGEADERVISIEFTGLIELDAPTAQALIDSLNGSHSHINNLSFQSLSKLEPEVAMILSRNKRHLLFSALKTLSTEVAEALSDSESMYTFRGMDLLSTEAARALVGKDRRPIFDSDQEPADRPKTFEIELISETELADLLSKSSQEEGGPPRKRGSIHFYDLEVLSPDAARELADFSSVLSFYDSSIPKSAALELAKGRNHLIASGMNSDFYDGILGHVGALSLYARDMTINHLSNLANGAPSAEKLYMINADQLSADMLRQLTLVKRPLRLLAWGAAHALPQRMSLEYAEILSERKGDIDVSFNLDLTPDVAKLLAKIDGSVELSISRSSAEAIRELMPMRGKIYSSQQLSDEVVLELANLNIGLYLSSYIPNQRTAKALIDMRKKRGRIVIVAPEYQSYINPFKHPSLSDLAE